MPSIKFKDINVTYQKKKRGPCFTVFDHFSLEIEDQKTTVIMGPSGSGKTTLLKATIGLIDPNEGSIYFDNQDVTDLPVFERNISYVSQELALYPHLSIYKNIGFPLAVQGVPAEEIKERVEEVARKLGIYHCLTRRPRELSIGQNQRVAIARAIVKKPDLFLFDEPFSNLDRELAAELRNELKKILNEEKYTCIFVTHNAEDAILMADNIVVLNEGKIIEQGSKEAILQSKNPEVLNLFLK